MNEKTAEEKLRQTLEGDVLGDTTKRASKRVVRRVKKPDTPIKVADSFMEDFEKKIEQSLRLSNVSSSNDKRKINLNNENKKELKQEQKKSARKIKIVDTPSELVEAVTPPAPKPVEVKTKESVPTPEEIEVKEEIKISEPSQEPKPEFIDQPEEINESEPEPEFIEVPPVEQPKQEKQEPEIPEINEQNLPDIPLISGDKETESEASESGENFSDEGLPEIPIISADSESDNENEFEIENSGTPEKEPEDFSPSADVVVNVAEEIPEQPAEIEPEGGSVPVSVEMPETTKTAEDKLMADIAEAMTGSPVSLETSDPVEAYKLPEDFLKEANADPSKQSAEDKLLANIAQAMSESPLDAAADNAVQNFENELEDLDGNLTASFPDREEPLTEEIDLSAYEEDKPEEKVQPEIEDDEPEKPETEIESTFEEVPLPQPVDEPEPEPAEEPEFIDTSAELLDDEEPEQQENELISETGEEENEEPQSEFEDEAEPEISENPEIEVEAGNAETNSDTITEINNDDNDSESSEKEDENEEDDESLFEGMPDELLEAMSMPDSESDAEDDVLTTDLNDSEAQDISSYSLNKNRTEVSQEDNMPEQNLLEEGDNNAFMTVDSNTDGDFDINSLGEAASFGDAEPENDFGFDENSPSHGGFMSPDPDEEKEKEKVMGLRESLQNFKGNKEKASKGNNKGSSSLGGIFIPILLIALLGMGGFIAWQLMQFTRNLAGGMPNTPAAMQSDTNPSYEYAIDFIFDSNLSGRMAQRGKEGWQVVGSRRTQDSITGQLGYEFIFMRKTAK